MYSKGKVMVGMSGGVDSSVAALLLKEQGYEVVGVTFRLWTPESDGRMDKYQTAESGCCSVDDVNDAKFVCHTLEIPHYVFNYKELFRKKVVDYFVGEYDCGATPNPCIACNRYIKFEAFLEKANSMGFNYIATGHYAGIEKNPETTRFRLKKGVYAPKDQSYFLYCMTQQQLASTLMPLGNYEKEEVRHLAEQNHLIVSQKPDSQDICFVPDGDYGRFLEHYTGRTCPSGNFIDLSGNILGKHKGIWYYTIGQRKGLGITFGKPMFVSNIDPVRNTITLADNEDLMCDTFMAEKANWIDEVHNNISIRLTAKIRNTHKPQPAWVTPMQDNLVKVQFEEPQRAITSGQAVVFYDGEYVVGGAAIMGQKS